MRKGTKVLASCILFASAILAGVGVLLPSAPAVAQKAPAGTGLPGGATSLSEGHGDWTVTCQASPAAGDRPARKACALSQRQVNQQGQIVFTVELRPTADGGAGGVLLLPFGVSVRDDVVLKVDGAAVGKPLAFSTCLPAGCIVPLTLGSGAVAALKGGKAATITAPTVGAAPVELNLVLNGFGGALARVSELAGQD